MVALPAWRDSSVAAQESELPDERSLRGWVRRRRPPNVVFSCWALSALALAIGAWSLATPLMAAPDEPAHAIEAAAAVRGQFELRSHGNVLGAHVQVPAWVASTANLPACLAYFPGVSAGCSPKLSTGTENVDVQTQFSDYPPLYYFVSGIPSLFSSGASALYLMRLAGALANSCLIALGLLLVIRYHPRRSSLLVGALVALTPMVFFLSSVLNSSGMEIAAAFAAWCGGLCIIERRPVSTALAGWTSLAFAVLVLSRPISPANAAVIILTLGLLVGWTRSWELLRERGSLPLRITLVASLIVAGVQFAFGGTPPIPGFALKHPLSLSGRVYLTVRLTGDRLRQTIGNFGWLWAPLPVAFFAAWSAVVTLVVAAGLWVSRGYRRALPFLALAIIAMPIVIESPSINSTGTFWQGRYWLPILIGVPLVAASRLPAWRRTSDRATLTGTGLVAVVLAFVVAQVWAFHETLHRYEYGAGAASRPKAGWAPPGGGLFVTGLFVLGMVLLVGFVALAPLLRPAPEPALVAPDPDVAHGKVGGLTRSRSKKVACNSDKKT